MDFLKLAADRYSVRKFSDKPIERETLEQILKAGYLAPTACNLQPQRILVIQSEEAVAKMHRCTKSHFGAPAALLVCYDKKICWKRSYDKKPSGEIDASIVTTHMMLEAASLGVGTTWVMHFNPEAIREEFKLPDNIEPVALLVMGHPAPDAEPYPGHTQFRPMEELVFYDQF
ncbi:MAG TPA: nitroreductase family protein [Clostridia bacterium]|nr:nitroreductase family protein [Clostridia bacterium]